MERPNTTRTAAGARTQKGWHRTLRGKSSDQRYGVPWAIVTLTYFVMFGVDRVRERFGRIWARLPKRNPDDVIAQIQNPDGTYRPLTRREFNSPEYKAKVRKAEKEEWKRFFMGIFAFGGAILLMFILLNIR